MIAGKILQATVSEHDWLTLVVFSGTSNAFASHKSDSAELHLSNGSVADGIAAGCSVRDEEVCEFAVAAKESTKTNLRAQACFVPSLGTGNRLLSLQWIKPTDGNCEFRHQPCNFDDFSVTRKITIKPNTSGWDFFDVMPFHVMGSPCHQQPNLPTDKACTSETSSKWTATMMGTNPDKEAELKNGDLFAEQQVSSNHQSTCLGRLFSSLGATNHSDMLHGGTIFVDNANGHIKIVFEDCFTTVSNSEGAIAANKWRIIAQHRSTQEWSDFDDNTNHDLADEWLTPDEAKVRSQQQHQDELQHPTPTDQDPDHFQWKRQQPPPSTPVAVLVEREKLGQSSPLTTSGSSAVCRVSSSSESPTQNPRHSPRRNPTLLRDNHQQQSILWDKHHHPSILWDNQHHPLTIQPSNASSASLPSSLASNRTRQVCTQPSRLPFQHNDKTRKTI